MPRACSCLRLSTQQECGRASEIGRLAQVLRRVAESEFLREPDVHWSFRRLNDDSLAVWLIAPPVQLERVTEEVRRLVTASGYVAESHDDDEYSAGRYAACHEGELTRKLSTISSEFALTVLIDGGLPDSRCLPLAVAHMRQVSDLVPDWERGGFLFSCWKDWTHAATPAQRVALEQWVATLSVTPAWSAEMGWTDEVRGAWRRYLNTLRAMVIDPDMTDSPVNYLLFEHAHLLHNRLGISASTEALAARLTRSMTPFGRSDEKPTDAGITDPTVVRVG